MSCCIRLAASCVLSTYGSLAPRIFLSYERDSRKGAEDPSLRLTLDRRML